MPIFCPRLYIPGVHILGIFMFANTSSTYRNTVPSIQKTLSKLPRTDGWVDGWADRLVDGWMNSLRCCLSSSSKPGMPKSPKEPST